MADSNHVQRRKVPFGKNMKRRSFISSRDVSSSVKKQALVESKRRAHRKGLLTFATVFVSMAAAGRYDYYLPVPDGVVYRVSALL